MDAYKIAVSNYKLESKLLPGDERWGAFNASFKNLEIERGELMNAIYYGRAITTHHANNWRATKNYLLGQHIGLDFDSGDENSAMELLAQDKFVKRYASFLHTTISHKPQAPRSRIVFLLEQPIYQAKNYALAAAALLWLFGTADRQCKDPVRFFYGAPGCDFMDIGQVLPLNVIKDLITSYQETGKREKRRTDRPDYRPPASQEEVSEALKFIPPWAVDYDEWVAILMAIHSEFGSGGFQLAEHWADGKPGEVDQKWRSFDQNGNEAGRVTVGTLFSIARRFGWGRLN